MLVGGRAFVAYPYREASPVPDGVAFLHVADNPEAFGREHAADMALLGDIGATLAEAARRSRSARQGQGAARLADARRGAARAGGAPRGKILAEDARAAERRRGGARRARRLPDDALIANDSAATFGRCRI